MRALTFCIVEVFFKTALSDEVVCVCECVSCSLPFIQSKVNHSNVKYKYMYITLTTPTKAHQFAIFMNNKETFELMETLTKIAIQE